MASPEDKSQWLEQHRTTLEVGCLLFWLTALPFLASQVYRFLEKPVVPTRIVIPASRSVEGEDR